MPKTSIKRQENTLKGQKQDFPTFVIIVIYQNEKQKKIKKMKNEAITTSKNEGIQLKLLFSVSDVAKSSYHYSLKHNVIEEKDMIIVEAYE